MKNTVKKISDGELAGNAPLVSICSITYNHENYIRDCIDGFLKQKTTFPVEIIIHDDASTDNTADIIRKYEEKYPQLFVTILQNENKYSQGIKPTNRYVYPKARGKYIAICEGDDYWTDPLKLQKQVEFLEANPEFSLCSHEAYYTKINDPNSIRKFAAILYRNFQLDGIKSLALLLKLFILKNEEFWKRRRKSPKLKRYSVADIKIALNTAMSDRYIPTLSIVGRSEILKSIPEEMTKLGAGHRLILLWSALHGKLFHMPEVMGIKNTQESSVTVTKIIGKISNEKYKFEHTILLLKQLKKHAPIKYKPELEEKIEFYESKATYPAIT